MPMHRLFLAFLLLLPAAAALAVGGQDILIDTTAVGGPPRCALAAAGDGTLFAMVHSDSTMESMNIYRSVNGGSTWQLWHELQTHYGQGYVYDGKLVVTDGSPGNVAVAWIDRRTDVVVSSMRVSIAPVDADVPVWTTTTVASVSSYGMASPRFATFPGTLAARFSLAWTSGGDISYAGSTDGGATWSAPLVLVSLGAGASLDFDVACDNNIRVHLVWCHNPAGGGSTGVYHRWAGSNGAFLFNWQPEQELSGIWSSGDLFGVTVAANPQTFSGGGVVVAAGGNYNQSMPMWLWESDDAGDTWSSPLAFFDLYYPDAAWGDDGVYIAADGGGWSVTGPGSLMHRDAGVWITEPMIINDGFSVMVRPQLALDPSRGGAPAVVSLRTEWSVDDQYNLWFDAAWRGDPGYGTPDIEPPLEPGSGAITRGVLPGDIDGDGALELVFAGNPNATYHEVSFYDPATGDVIYTTSELHPSSDIALVDSDGDGDLEVFWVRAVDGKIEGRQGDGASLDGFPTAVTPGLAPYPKWVSGAGVTGATEDDIVVACYDEVHVLGPGAVNRPGWPWTAPAAAGQVNGRVALGDVDADGRCDLVVPLTGGVVILDRDGQLVGQFGQGEAAAGSPSLADFDDDGDLEIAIPRADGTVHLVHHDGTPAGAGQWPYDSGAAGMPSQVALADIVGDARRDLVFTDADRRVHIVPPSGNVPADWPRQINSDSPVIEPVVAKLGPGDPVMAIGDANGRVRLMDSVGQQDGWSRVYRDPVEAPLSAADVDGDGMIELIVPTSRQLWILDMGVGVAAEDSLKLWPMSGADPGRTGCVFDGEPPVVAAPDAPVALAVLHGAAPNPFNPMTTISFSVPAGAAKASLRVYDAAGRLVRSLHRGALAPGDHAVTWRGDDHAGRAVPSGVYFCRLETDGHVQGKSLVLVR